MCESHAFDDLLDSPTGKGCEGFETMISVIGLRLLVVSVVAGDDGCGILISLLKLSPLGFAFWVDVRWMCFLLVVGETTFPLRLEVAELALQLHVFVVPCDMPH